MSSRNQKDKAKNVQEKYQMILSRLLREEDNKYCADCDAKGPRWASWNLGVFLCIRCAGIHRNLGVHISKVKSVNLDTWTEEQILSVENGGNTIGRRIYEKFLPADLRRPTTDSNSLENFIRNKYDHKKYMDKDYVRPAPKRIQDREIDSGDKKEKKNTNSAAARHKQQTLVALAKAREAVPRPHPSGLQPSAAASLSSSLSQSSPNLAVETQPLNSLPSTPVKTVASANDLLGLYTPPASNVNDLLGLNTPPVPTPSSQLATSNGTPEGAVETSLFGDDAEVAGAGGKKTKDSIMALFASSSGQQQPAYNVPGGVYIPTQKQPFAANGYPANSTMAGYQPNQQPAQAGVAMTGYQQQQPQPNNIQGYGMMGQQQGIVGQQQGLVGQQQAMMGQQQGMVGQQQGMVGQQHAMMGQQQGMMGMQGVYGAQMTQQSAYLQQQQQQHQQQQQQQFQMMQQQMTQQIQQQMNSMRVSGETNPPQGQMQQPNWQQNNTVMSQQQAVPTANMGVGSMSGWGGASSGQTLSNQLWK